MRHLRLSALALLLAAPLIAQAPATQPQLDSLRAQLAATSALAARLGPAQHDTVLKHDTITKTVTVTVASPPVHDTVFVPVATPPTTPAVPVTPPVTPPVVAPPVAPPSTAGAAADLANENFENGWGHFTDWSGNPTPTGVSRDSTTAADGKWSVKRSWVPNPGRDVGDEMIISTGAHDSLFVRMSVKLTAPINTVMKFFRVYDPRFNTPLGGLFLARDGGGSAGGNGLLNAGTDQENGAITTTIGVTQAQMIDGQWHSIEMAYWRNGDASGFPCFAFRFDGKPQAMPDGTAVKYAGAGNNSTWKGGKLCSDSRASTLQLGYIELLATLNANNTTTGAVWIDRIAISSTGWPTP